MRQSVPVNTFESLETRTLFAAAVLSHGVLNVVGDGAAANAIVVANSADGASVNVSINWTTARGVDKSVNKSFPKSLGILAVRVRGGFRNDLISVGQANAGLGIAALDLPSFVRGLAGNDVITTAGGNDIVFAGAGNDLVSAGAGTDWIRGMAGNDSLDGGGGNDLMFGGFGNDALGGGAGDDTLWGGVGDDSLDGGAGNDSLGGILGTNAMIGGQGQDTFHVRDLAFNPTNDYNSAEDVLDVVRVVREATPPAA